MHSLCLHTQTARRLSPIWKISAPHCSPREARSPVCWEVVGLPKTLEGPVEYCCRFRARDLNPSRRYWLFFEGVSYETVGWLNDQLLGQHRGIWDSFAWEITSAVQSNNELRLSIVKNGGARFPTAQVLSGFLPYVSTTFGGLWGDVYWVETGAVAIRDLFVRGQMDGDIHIETRLDGFGSGMIQLRALDDQGKEVARAKMPYQCKGSALISSHLKVASPRLWGKEPALYRLQASVFVGSELSHQAEQVFGFRQVQAKGSRILLNGEPFYLRGLLHWGWYPNRIAPQPGAQAQQELKALKSLGFNALKACLWVPPKHFLTKCDEIGIAVWLELPLWLPKIETDESFKQVYQEYKAILRQTRNHPSVMLFTMGCELSERFPSEWLESLYRLTKELTGSPLVRDNSGGGECYGGALKEHADFYDYHLYCDIHHARPTFEHFLPKMRESRPWLQGEFCDTDGYRDFERLRHTFSEEHLWWLSQDPQMNPQGVRWLYETPFIEDRLKQAGIAHRRQEMLHSSRGQMLAHHKYTIETMRAYPETSGYVVTGFRDTPVSTSGLLDDFGKVKIAPAMYRLFNADDILLINWRKRRVWQGGDRPAFADEFNHFGGQTLYPSIALARSNCLPKNETLRWEFRAGSLCRRGEIRVAMGEESVNTLATLEIALPPVKTARKGVLKVTLGNLSNQWNLWVYPRPDKNAFRGVGLYDPALRFSDFAEAMEMRPLNSRQQASEVPFLIASRWEHWMTSYVEHGGKLILIQSDVTGLPAKNLPFWRECFRLFEPHPVWLSLPHEGFTDLQFLAFSADHAFDSDGVCEQWGERAIYKSLLKRVDARTGYTHDYLIELSLGKGRALLTTLHFAGANGTTPLTLEHHPAGQVFLSAALQFLKDDAPE